MIWVIAANALPEYGLSLRFSDGSEGEVDLRSFILQDSRAIVSSLRDPEKFAAMRVMTDTVVWDNGFDLAPEYLYANATSGRDPSIRTDTRRTD